MELPGMASLSEKREKAYRDAITVVEASIAALEDGWEA
jgi:hypothetical protein